MSAILRLTAVWLAGLALVLAVLLLRHDLRGTAPQEPLSAHTPIASTTAAGIGFSLADCLPGTVSLHDLPLPEEAPGSASMTVISCRSRSSMKEAIMLYLLGVLASGFALRRAAKPSRRQTGKNAP